MAGLKHFSTSEKERRWELPPLLRTAKLTLHDRTGARPVHPEAGEYVSYPVLIAHTYDVVFPRETGRANELVRHGRGQGQWLTFDGTAMQTNRVKYFRWTPRTARITFMYAVFVPAIFGVVAYQTDVSLCCPSPRVGLDELGADENCDVPGQVGSAGEEEGRFDFRILKHRERKPRSKITNAQLVNKQRRVNGQWIKTTAAVRGSAAGRRNPNMFAITANFSSRDGLHQSLR